MSRRGPHPRAIEERLNSRWREDPATGCWLWTRQTLSNGYGVIRVGSMCDGTRRQALAHRVSWELDHGPIPDGLFVLHRCDRPACINPAHLFLGTQQDNLADMRAKGRAVNPPRNANNGWWWKQRTHCKNGHEFNEANTYMHQNSRHCRQCNKLAVQRRKETRS